MKSITDPKKLAASAVRLSCWSCPFDYQSGSSVSGRPGVSQHARKRLESLFHLGAMAAIRAKGELQDYYQRAGGPAVNHVNPVGKIFYQV